MTHGTFTKLLGAIATVLGLARKSEKKVRDAQPFVCPPPTTRWHMGHICIHRGTMPQSEYQEWKRRRSEEMALTMMRQRCIANEQSYESLGHNPHFETCSEDWPVINYGEGGQ